MKDLIGLTLLDRDEHMRPDTTMQSLAALKPSFSRQGEVRLRRRGAAALSARSSSINHVHHAGNSSGIVDGAAAVLIGTRRRASAGPQAARAHPRLRLDRLRAVDHADRPGVRDARRCWRAPA